MKIEEKIKEPIEIKDFTGLNIEVYSTGIRINFRGDTQINITGKSIEEIYKAYKLLNL